MDVDAAQFLVIEDSMVGVKAANTAGMEVVAVPPHGEAAGCSALANTVLHSLLDFRPEHWGLPPFEYWVDNALPIEAIYLSGLYMHEFVNEDTDDGKSALPDQVSGVFFGWALVDMKKSYRVVIGIGMDHSSGSPKKTIEVLALDSESLEECKSIASTALDIPIFSQHAQLLEKRRG